MRKMLVFRCFIITALVFAGCQEKKPKSGKPPTVSVSVPEFNSDSAYAYVAQQVAFGPRVPNTEEHRKCGDYLISKLRQFADTVLVQETKLKAFDGNMLNVRNIIAEFDTDKPNRILLFAHWDTRPFADQDTVNKDQPILGANDGGSGVGVLTEIARQLAATKANAGVDIILFDAEDYGQPEDSHLKRQQDTYCLGSQYWSKNPHRRSYYAQYGILLDMVGAKDATFTREGLSNQYAPSVVKKVWNAAAKLGYSNYFLFQDTDARIDDHYYVNTVAKIPSIDIIEYFPGSSTKFGSYWHTHADNMDIISRNTLKAVGQTVLEVIYNEK